MKMLPGQPDVFGLAHRGQLITETEKKEARKGEKG